MPKSRFLADEAATIASAQGLAPQLTAGQTLLLEGDLGAGKSTFARAVIRALPLADGSLASDEIVPSPTFTLVQVYERALGPVYHFDLYRLKDPGEVWELGWEEAQTEGLRLIEWPQRLGHLTPKGALTLRFLYQVEGRWLEIHAGTTGDARP